MSVSEAKKRANARWNASKDNIMIRPTKEEGTAIRSAAAAAGQSNQQYILQATRERMERDGGTPAGIAVNRPESTPGARVVCPPEALRTAQEGTETGERPFPIDKAKAWENISEIFRDMGVVDLEAARDGRLGIVCIFTDTLETAQQAADAAGEAVADFIRRAVEAQVQRDQTSRKLGINPATGGKLEKEA